VSPPAACSFRDGLQALTDALHAAYKDSVRLGTAARRLVPARGRWTIELDSGEVEADTVVLTCEAAAAAALLAGAAPDVASGVRRLAYNDLAIVHLHAPGARLEGLGYQVALGEDFVTRGVTWNDSLFGREGVHTAFLGGATRPGATLEPDDRLGEIAVREFHRITGREARVLRVSRARMPAWDVSWEALAGLSPPPGIRFAAKWESRPGIAGRLLQARRIAGELGRARRPETC
jgi:oxygen-dependent protoporphyrinogen oxidase